MNQETTTTFLNGTHTAKPLQTVVQPSPETMPQAKRRSFTAAYKRQVVERAAQCTQSGEIGALLRREGLYASQLADWRQQVAAGQLRGTKQSKRSRAPEQTREQKENIQLKRKIARLEQQLAEAELLITAQKKVAELLDLLSQQRQERPL